MQSALEGISVLDFSWGFSGALTTMILCDNGADVIKVEPPSGDPQRSLPAFAQWHRGKRGIVIDLKDPVGQARARELAKQADLLVQSWRPGVAEAFGLGYEELSADHPELIYCAITGFGPRGPLASIKGYEGVVSAKVGTMAGPDRPQYSALPQAAFGAAQGALQGILAALYVRGTCGRGQKVETSLLQGMMGFGSGGLLEQQLRPEFAEQLGVRSVFHPLQRLFAFTKDGAWLQFSNFRPHLLKAFMEAIGLPDWYEAAVSGSEPPDVLVDAVLHRIHDRDLNEWMDVFLEYDDIGVEPVRSPREAMDHPQMLYNGHVIDVFDRVLGRTRQIGPLVTMAKTPARPGAGAPAFGGDGDGDGVSFRSPNRRRSGSHPRTGPPLAGVTVVELGWFLAAPYGTALLADLGARVIKIENHEGDPIRYMSSLRELSGVKTIQGKESIALDYRSPEGYAVLERIVKRADVVMRSFRESPSINTGIDYERLAAINPDLIYLYAGAYGAAGPYAARPGFDPTMSVAAGLRARQSGWDNALEGRKGFTFEEGCQLREEILAGPHGGGADPVSALVVGTGLLLGLVARQRTGLAQYMQTTMLCSSAYYVSDAFFDHDGMPVVPGHNEDGVDALYRLYPTQAGWVFLAAPLPSEWPKLCRGLDEVTGDASALGADGRFATPEGRRSRDTELSQALGSIFVTRSAEEWEKQLLAHDVACVAVSEEPASGFIISSETVIENGFVAEVEHPLFGRHLRHGPMATLSMTPGTVGPACLVGQHTRAILDELGYSEAEVEGLRSRGIVTWPED
jgi:crotonobetainyl-CoA:carnitine CoA-transferase CaiB-like acyl-CoA transferase